HDDIEIAGEGFVKADFSGGDASRLEETLLGCERRLFIVAAHDAETAGFAGIVGSGDRTLAEVLYAIARNRGLVAGLHDENALFPPGGQGDNADDGDAEPGMSERHADARARQAFEALPCNRFRHPAKLDAIGKLRERAHHQPEPETDAERRKP